MTLQPFNRATLCCLALTFSTAVPAQPAPLVFRNLTLDVSVRETPTAVPLSDGKYHVAYVAYVTSWLNRDLTVRSVEIGPEGREPIARFDSAALADPIRFRSTYSIPAGPALTLQGGRTAILNVQFTSPTAVLPAQLVHTFRFERDSTIRMRHDDGTTSPDIVARSVPVTTGGPPVVIDAPLRGGPWRCGNGLSFDNSHSVMYPHRAALMRVPQRFGCDFLRTDSAGSTLPNPFPNTISNEMFYGYGAELLAVADGVISFVKDGIPENVPQADGRTIMAVPLTNETVSGNWVSLRIADGVYAFYAHLQPGSIRVKAGDRVRRGQVIGLLGNSGNSAAPHLHFHVGNANSLNGSDAVPHVYRSFVWLGNGRADQASDPRTNQLPGPSAIVRFP